MLDLGLFCPLGRTGELCGGYKVKFIMCSAGLGWREFSDTIRLRIKEVKEKSEVIVIFSSIIFDCGMIID
jgi:hypothetical protein